MQVSYIDDGVAVGITKESQLNGLNIQLVYLFMENIYMMEAAFSWHLLLWDGYIPSEQNCFRYKHLALTSNFIPQISDCN